MRHYLPKPRQQLKVFGFLAAFTTFLTLKLQLLETSNPLHPIQSLGEDKPFARDARLLILQWTSFFSSQDWKGFHKSLDPTCPYQCEFTSDRRRLNDSDALLFNIRNLESSWGYDLPSEPRKIKQVWVAHSAEPPQHTYPHPANFPSVFNWTSFVRADSDVPLYYKKMMRRDELRTNQRVIWSNTSVPKLPVISEKRALASWLVSNCNTYSRRERYVQRLKSFVKVAIYGQCWGRNCNRAENQSACLEEVKKHIFYLSFENALCTGYVTEKFWNALVWGMIPVVMADRASVEQVAPPGSYIHVEDFDSPEELARHLRNVSQDQALYQSYFKWRKTHVLVADYFCDLCSRLYTWDGHLQTYKDFGGWFTQDPCSNIEFPRRFTDKFRELKHIISRLFL